MSFIFVSKIIKAEISDRSNQKKSKGTASTSTNSEDYEHTQLLNAIENENKEIQRRNASKRNEKPPIVAGDEVKSNVAALADLKNLPELEEVHSEFDSGMAAVNWLSHTSENLYEYQVCDKTSANQWTTLIARGRSTNTSEQPFLCDVCGLGFGCKSSFVGHYGTHTGDKPYECDICGKRFGYKRSFVVHYGMHMGPYECDVCGKGFSRNRELVRHYNTHKGGNRPYACEICGKRFGYMTSLVAHCRTHTCDTPYKNEICGKGFTKNNKLVGHRRTHAGKLPYECEICRKGFIKKSDLDLHLTTHTCEKPFKCGLCDESFVACHQLTAHVGTVHFLL